MPDATTQPNLGYGKPTEATIDQVNIWMRGQPWYQEQMRQWGQDPGHPNLAKSQSEQILKMAQAQGVVVDQGHMEVDDHGNFNPIGHKLRNTLIVIGIAGATIATMGAAGAFSGSALAGSTAATGATGATAGTAGTLAATTTVPLMTGTIAGSVASGAVPAALATGGTVAGTAGVTGAALASHATAPLATGTIAGSVPSGAVPAASVSTGGNLASTFGIGNNLNTYSTLAGTAGNIFTNIYGANKQADANKYAADLADAATKRAEQFSREQAEGAYQSNEHTQKANYDQWRAREDAIMGSLGHQLGINYTAPEYSPGIDPRYTGGAAAPTGTAPTGAAADPAQAFIANWQRTHDPKEGIEPLAKAYKAAGFGDRFLVDGTTPSNNELVVGGQKYKVLSGENGASPSWYIPGSNDGGAAPVMRPSLAATFVRPNFVPLPTPYQPGTLGAYVGS